MTPTLELVSIQYALALLIGQDLDLRTMLRKFLPPALRLLNGRSGYIWLRLPEASAGSVPEPCYSYPVLRAQMAVTHPTLTNYLQQFAANAWEVKKPGEVRESEGICYHFLPIGDTGLLVLERTLPLPESFMLALGLVLKRLETACLACMQHAYVEVARKEALQAKELAEKASKAKSEFLGMISHEIRTPMNGVMGLTDLMLYSEVSDTQREYLEMIKASSTVLLGILNEILDFSRIDAGSMELNTAPFRLQALLKDTFMPLAIQAGEKSLGFHWNIAPDVPDALNGDAVRLRQILISLVSNAIKFTPQGEVVISVSLQSGAPAGQVNVLFAVRDTGIGISPEKQATIFQPFQQADNSITRRYGGTGLGLTIASQLVAMMGGALQLESDVGNGSLFRFSLPFHLAATSPP